MGKIQKIRKIRKKSVFSRFPRISVIFGISSKFLPKNDMFRQKPGEISKTIYLAQNRKQNIKIQCRTLWKSFQLECTIFKIILYPDLYLMTSPKIISAILFLISHTIFVVSFIIIAVAKKVVRSPKKPSLNPIKSKITSPSRFLLITFVILNILSPNFMTFIIFI